MAGGPGNTVAMAPTADAAPHHHRSTTKQSHKPFKPRFASKGALKDLAKGENRALGEWSFADGHRQDREPSTRSRETSYTSSASHVKADPTKPSQAIADPPS